MTLPDLPGCPWPLDPSCCSDWAEYPEDVQLRAQSMATETLSRLTAYRITNCTVTVRPCTKRCGLMYPSSLLYMSSFSPYQDASGAWLNFWVNGCGHQDECSCSSLCSVRLPGPVGRVDEVKVDGVVVDPSDYRVKADRLIWTGSGTCPWPSCQDLSLADTEVGTFSVTYVNGYPPDGLAAYACGLLACEFAKACTSNGKCRLPSTVSSIVRQGVTMELVVGAFPNGVTGIREIDTFVALWNPKGRMRESAVYSPDLR